MDDRSWVGILLAGGTLFVAIGTYLPWLRRNPDLHPLLLIPQVHYIGKDGGLVVFDFALLGAVGLVLLTRVITLRTELRTTTILAAGLGILVFPAYYLSNYRLAGFFAVYVPAIGWYLTVLGGILFTIAGGLELPSTIHDQR